MSEMKNVGSVDVTKTTSKINRDKSQREEGVCYFNSASYSPGAQICSNGNLLRCSPDGSWTVVGTC
jgi:Protein of unknown function (DUF1496)